jgi:mannose-6-phosphate isomerase
VAQRVYGDGVQPITLGPNQPRQFYRGGKEIAALRGTVQVDEYRPEDWVASSTARYELDPDGLSRLPDGRYLRDVLQSEPEAWLGPEHVGHFGAEPALLVKLLHAGERLPVHFHPDRSFALRHLGSRHGKTEAWAVLGTAGAEPSVWLGWSRDVQESEVAGWVASQDRASMLGALNRLVVRPGDAVLVPAGTPHAIGEGVFCVEVQEPTDYSIMLEFDGFDLDPAGGELGLGREMALSCLRHEALSPAAMASLTRARTGRSSGVEEVFPPASRPYFRAQRVWGGRGVPLEESFAVIVVIEGEGKLKGESWQLDLHRGTTAVVPWAAGPSIASGAVELLRCLPPLAADAREDEPGL